MFIYIHILLLLISLNILVHLINTYDTSSNNNVDIKCSAHNAFLEQPLSDTFLEQPLSGTFLEQPLSGTLKIEI